MKDVKLLRLTTGEDIVAEVTNQDYEDNVKTVTTIKKPFVLIPMAQNPGTSQESKLYFSPFIPFAENEEFDIKEENIITVNEPKTDIRDNYLNYVGAIVPVEKKIISWQIKKMIKQRNESCEIYKKAGRNELLESETREIEVISIFLPKQLSEEETKKICQETVKDVGASSMKDMGKVMGVLKAKHADTIDFSKVSSIIKELLS